MLIITAIYRAHHARKLLTPQETSRKNVAPKNQAQPEKEKFLSIKTTSSIHTNSVDLVPKPSPTKNNDKASKNQTTKSKEKQITLMLLTLSLKFIILTLPLSLFELFRAMDLIIYIFDIR